MFTGIVTDIGEVATVEPGGASGDRRFRLLSSYDMDGVAIGASIACSGCCLTVVAKGNAQGRGWFDVEASRETLDRTKLGDWRVGTRVNLERSLKVGDELGGHLVYGHVDGVGRIVECRPEAGSVRTVFEAPDGLARFVASKGSIAVDGVSLTVNEVDGARFGVNVISHTRAATTFGTLAEGDRVNLEVDMLARYVARLLGRGA